MLPDLAQQFYAKEICLRHAVNLYDKAVDTTETIVETAKKLEVFFYTNPPIPIVEHHKTT